VFFGQGSSGARFALNFRVPGQGPPAPRKSATHCGGQGTNAFRPSRGDPDPGRPGPGPRPCIHPAQGFASASRLGYGNDQGGAVVEQTDPRSGRILVAKSGSKRRRGSARACRSDLSLECTPLPVRNHSQGNRPGTAPKSAAGRATACIQSPCKFGCARHWIFFRAQALDLNV